MDYLPLDNGLSDYRLTSTEITLWNMNDKQTELGELLSTVMTGCCDLELSPFNPKI